MFIKKLQFKNFKRFSDLEINLDPKNTHNIPKLVLLIGTNGSGKSCVFDGLENLNTLFKYNLKATGAGQITENSINYYHKNGQEYSINCEFDQNNFYKFTHTQPNALKVESNLQELPDTAFYGRTAFSYIPQIQITSINSGVNIGKDEDRARYFISEDKNRFENDINKAIGDIVSNIITNPKQAGEYAYQLKNSINKAFTNVFGITESISLGFDNLDTPSDGNPLRFWFIKGNSRIDYNRLSAGEKMVFVILFNLYVRNKYFQDTVYFFDEIDLHLNAQLQYNFLKEITENWIPNNCQLWTASHSLGFIQYAQNYGNGAIIDFDSLDFDKPQIIKPSLKDSLDVFEIAVPKTTLEVILKGKKIYFCEGKNDKYYNLLGLDNIVFIGGTTRNKDSILFDTKNTNYYGIIDRDYLTDEELFILKSEYKNIKVLEYYSIENYWYHPDNLLEIEPNFDISTYKQTILEAKNQSLINMEIHSSRKKYLFFKEKDTVLEKGTEEIRKLLNSEDFETFYAYFDIKKYFKDKPNWALEQLTRTNWLQSKIKEVLDKS